VFLRKLSNGVQLETLPGARGYTSLEEMRIITLASVQTIKLLVIHAKPPVEAGLRKFRRLLQSPSLEKVIVVGGTECIEGEKISDSVSEILYGPGNLVQLISCLPLLNSVQYFLILSVFT
jgi:hypothetical protein